MSTQGAVTTKDLTISFGWEGSEAFTQHDVQECMAHVFEHLQVLGAGTPLGKHISMDQTGLTKGYV